jgi:calcineurin-like phosphoesterase family protein
MTRTFFTSDTHFNDPNTLERRGGVPNDDDLVDLWNSAVGRGDLIYCLGDFAFSWGAKSKDYIHSLVSRLNGTKILITGNHDREEVVRAPGWAWVGPYKEIKPKINGAPQKIVLLHYPLRTWNGRDSWHCHGHCHGALKPSPHKMYDVGVDCNDFMPVSLERLAEIMNNKPQFNHEP